MNAFAINSSIISQLKAGLFTLKNCIDLCPENEWNEKHNDYPFSQVVFHTLFFCDYYLCDYDSEFKEQKFHKENILIFDDYEEMKDGMPTKLYEKVFILEYYQHCKNKVEKTIRNKTLESLIELKSDVTKNMTKIERYLNLIRHIQHHSAQLGLQLQYVSGKEMDWVRRGDS